MRRVQRILTSGIGFGSTNTNGILMILADESTKTKFT